MLISGLAAILLGLSILTGVFVYWSAHGLEPIANVLPAVIGTCALAVGTQNILGGFLLAIVSGNEAEFLQPARNQIPGENSVMIANSERAGSGTLLDLPIVKSPDVAPTLPAGRESRPETIGL
jgi:hypothetical protein